MQLWSQTIAIDGVDIDIADTFFRRFLGLMGRRSLSENRALLIVPCADVHTAFMRFPIDVVFIDKDGCITKIVRNLVPWRVAVERKAYACIELKSGAAHRHQLKTGQFLLQDRATSSR